MVSRLERSMIVKMNTNTGKIVNVEVNKEETNEMNEGKECSCGRSGEEGQVSFIADGVAISFSHQSWQT